MTGSPGAHRTRPTTSGKKVKAAVASIFTTMAGFDTQCGLRLSGMLRNARLADVEAEGRCSHIHGGSPVAESMALLLEQLRGVLEGAELLTPAEVDQAIAEYRVDSGRWGYSLVAAWGRNPSD